MNRHLRYAITERAKLVRAGVLDRQKSQIDAAEMVQFAREQMSITEQEATLLLREIEEWRRKK